jgi:2-keto-4-pentenoate hydratase/2-oxohepta-3-ene-1,7-dioic acid hydratase in catechol pathway
VRIARALVGGHPPVGEVTADRFRPLVGNPFVHRSGGQRSDADARALSELPLLSPVEPRTMLAVMGGFLEPGQTRKGERPPMVLCPKIVPELGGQDAAVVRPPFVDSLVMEAEMAVVVGRTLRRAGVEEAAEAIWGYTCCNDATATQYFPQFYLAKGFDTFGSLGPWVVTDLTPDQIEAGLSIVGRRNGVEVQRASTAHYKYLPWEWLAYVSSFLTLFPGDVITLGTPPPPSPVVPGDLVEIEVEGIGVLTNRIVDG